MTGRLIGPTDAPLPADAVAALRRVLGRRLVHPHDTRFSGLAGTRVDAPDGHPRAVLVAGDVEDVRTAVEIASAHALALTVAAAAPRRSRPGWLLVRLDLLDDVTVDARTGTAHVGAGATWATLAARARTQGLRAADAGDPGRPVVTDVLTGSAGSAVRRSVRTLDVVTAGGTLRTVGPGSDPRLFALLLDGTTSPSSRGDVVVAVTLTLEPAA